MTPEDRKYTKEHEWVRLEGGVATVGITDHAQDSLGEITFVELPAVGDEFKQGDAAAVVESAKAASDVYAPIGGKVTEINKALDDAPEKVNEDPYGEGWFYKMEAADAAEADGLMDAAAYKEFAEKDAH